MENIEDPVTDKSEIKREWKDRFIFNVVIDDKLMEVWERKETHELGEWNGEINNWWVKRETKGKVEWVPWLNSHKNRPAWEINIKVQNHMRFKREDWDISSSGRVEIKCNLRPVYSFFARNLDYAFSKARSLIFQMEEHPFCFADPDKEIGRKIYYHRQPAIISSLKLEDGEIYMDYAGDGEGFDMIHPWDRESDWPVSDWHGSKSVRDDIFTHEIWWFRK